MRVLIVDNTMDRDSWGAEDLRRLASRGGATVTVRRAPERDLPRSARGFDRVVLSGSRASALDEAPWITGLHELVRSALAESVPFLGVCFGHQTLANVLGGKNHRSQEPEFGWTRIELIDSGARPAPLLEGLPGSFYSFSAHFEEVERLPPEARPLARSSSCAIQSFQLGEKPVYGIQFHPERDVTGADRSFRERRKSKPCPPLLNPDRSAELYDPRIGETIFRNFL